MHHSLKQQKTILAIKYTHPNTALIYDWCPFQSEGNDEALKQKHPPTPSYSIAFLFFLHRYCRFIVYFLWSNVQKIATFE